MDPTRYCLGREIVTTSLLLTERKGTGNTFAFVEIATFSDSKWVRDLRFLHISLNKSEQMNQESTKEAERRESKEKKTTIRAHVYVYHLLKKFVLVTRINTNIEK